MNLLNPIPRLSCGAGAIIALLALIPLNVSAQTFTTLHDFDNNDGGAPWAKLIQATDGDFYGTTQVGGTSANCPHPYQEGGCGTVFKISPGGGYTLLHIFDKTDGDGPAAALMQGPSGEFYGTTYGGAGGFRGPAGLAGNGSIFKISSTGEFSTLYVFNFDDGSGPAGDLILGTDGFVYGTTEGGGPANAGSIFKIDSKGRLTTLHFFSAAADGCSPTSGLVQATDGNLYGTAFSCGLPYTTSSGTIFKITPEGDFTLLHTFTNVLTGLNPQGGLMQASDGNFYGTTEIGGKYGDSTTASGTVWKMTPSGAFTVLHSFVPKEGDTPVAQLTEGTDGYLYGVGAYDGAYANFGAVFKISFTGTLTTLHSFDSSDGSYPYAALLQATDGKFYAPAFGGGPIRPACWFGCGTVFSVSTGLSPFVKTVPAAGAAGTAVEILGTDLTKTTAVTFNGTPALFQIISASEVKTTVPTNSASGKVEVKTDGVTLKSNTVFRVMP